MVGLSFVATIDVTRIMIYSIESGESEMGGEGEKFYPVIFYYPLTVLPILLFASLIGAGSRLVGRWLWSIATSSGRSARRKAREQQAVVNKIDRLESVVVVKHREVRAVLVGHRDEAQASLDSLDAIANYRGTKDGNILNQQRAKELADRLREIVNALNKDISECDKALATSKEQVDSLRLKFSHHQAIEAIGQAYRLLEKNQAEQPFLKSLLEELKDTCEVANRRLEELLAEGQQQVKSRLEAEEEVQQINAVH